MRNCLPLYRAGGEAHQRFASLRDLENDLLEELPSRQPRVRLSFNAKTSVSLDFPIGHTCDPTPTCASVCYASGSRAPARWPKSVRLRLQNWLAVRSLLPSDVVRQVRLDFRRLAERYRRHRGIELRHFRVNGTGDIFPELVPVVNELAEREPLLAIWVVTRRFDLAAKLLPAPNLYLQLSLDASTRPEMVRAAQRLMALHPRAYLSFLRVEARDDTLHSAIVFNEKNTKGLPYRSKTDCPVDAGALELGNIRGAGGTACARCGKCFDERTLARQRAQMEVHS